MPEILMPETPGGVDWKTMPGWAIDWADAYLGKIWREGFWTWWYRCLDEEGRNILFGKDDEVLVPNAISFNRKGYLFTYTLRRDDAEQMYTARQRKN